MRSGPANSSQSIRVGNCRVHLYVFGSALRSQEANDLDVLIVYPPSTPADVALCTRSKLVCQLQAWLPTRVHAVLLSETEEAEIGFIAREGCTPLADADMRRLARRKTVSALRTA